MSRGWIVPAVVAARIFVDSEVIPSTSWTLILARLVAFLK
jgi:hypothetical protein